MTTKHSPGNKAEYICPMCSRAEVYHEIFDIALNSLGDSKSKPTAVIRCSCCGTMASCETWLNHARKVSE